MARYRRKKWDADWWISKLLLAVCAFAAFVFAVVVYSTELLPLRLFVLVCAALGLALLLVALLTWSPRYRVRFVLGLLLAVAMLAVFAMGTYYVGRGLDTAKEITTVSVETAEVGIYVRSEDTNDFGTAAAGYTYGILDILDRENTDEAIGRIEEEYGVTLPVRYYPGLPQLMDGLYGGEVDAIIMNTAYLDLLEDMEGYGDVKLRLREVHVAHVERAVETSSGAGGQEERPEGWLQGSISAPAAGTGQASGDNDAQEGMIFTVFLSGIDSRSGLIAKSRSDVNILASVNTATRQVALISTPRDFFVPLSISGGQRDKLTHAGIYGVNVCMDTLAMLYNVDVDYYFRVNFSGFEEIVDALGGVTVYNDQAFTSVDGYYYPAGEIYLDGMFALGFVRERDAFASGDRQRGKNQMKVIKAALDKALSPELLMNFSQILSAVEGSFETSIPYDTLSAIVREQLDSGGEWNVVSYSVDGTGSSAVPYSMSQSAYVMIPDETTVASAQKLIYQVYTGQTVTAP